MREIKFRGLRIDNKEWVYGYYFLSPLTDENSGTDSSAGWFFLTGETRHCISRDGVVYVVDPATVGQYTELKDKNDVEIYDGSILKSTDETVKVFFNSSLGSWDVLYAGGDSE